MMQNKYLFGITGGTGAGKSTVSKIIREMGYTVIDCDLISRRITQKGMPCLKELADEFGRDILCPDGTLDRRKLGDIVFSDRSSLKKLNNITHKYILAEIYADAENAKGSMVGVDGAVLFESGIAQSLCKIIGVIADEDTRMHRIIKRDGISEADAKNRIDSQMSNSFYIDNCDFIIYNNADNEELARRVKEVVEKLDAEE